MKYEFIKGNNELCVLISENTDIKEIIKDVPYSYLVIYDFDWEKDLSPWPIHGIHKQEQFDGKADDFINQIIDLINNEYDYFDSYIIAGYSLAGLFSLYMCTKTPLFNKCVSASGSLWYPNLLDYLQHNHVNAQYVYLSLGDKEKNTKNPIMKEVQHNTEQIYSLMQAYTSVFYELNEGNHFYQANYRLNKGLLRIYKEQ